MMASRFTIPARRGKAIEIDAGTVFRVVNTHGSQVLDSWAFSASDISTFMSMEHSRSFNSHIHLRPGDTLVTNRYTPIMTVLADTSPGVHDTLMCSCSQAIYARMGCKTKHDNCEDNLHAALGELGLQATHTPGPLNLFMNYPVGAEGEFSRLPPESKPGDYVEFRAEMNLVLVLSACPQDLMPINGVEQNPTEAHVMIVK